jgi:heparan-sulfate lyase
VDRHYFVFVDEAIGNAKGSLDLHFQFAPGPSLASDKHEVHTNLPGHANVEVWEPSDAPVDVIRERGQISSKFNVKEERPAIAYHARSGAPFVYLTVVAPYEGVQPPKVNARIVNSFAANGQALQVELSIDGRRWSLSRDLRSGDAICTALARK